MRSGGARSEDRETAVRVEACDGHIANLRLASTGVSGSLLDAGGGGTAWGPLAVGSCRAAARDDTSPPRACAIHLPGPAVPRRGVSPPGGIHRLGLPPARVEVIGARRSR